MVLEHRDMNMAVQAIRVAPFEDPDPCKRKASFQKPLAHAFIEPAMCLFDEQIGGDTDRTPRDGDEGVQHPSLAVRERHRVVQLREVAPSKVLGLPVTFPCPLTLTLTVTIDGPMKARLLTSAMDRDPHRLPVFVPEVETRLAKISGIILTIVVIIPCMRRVFHDISGTVNLTVRRQHHRQAHQD